MTLAQAFDDLVKPAFFPFRLRDLRGDIRLMEAPREFKVGAVNVSARAVPHLGPTFGYRVEHNGSTLAYVSDHQQPTAIRHVSESVLEFCAGVDVLVHDAQYTDQEFQDRPHWGHSTVDYAVEMARRVGVARLCLFHHDPAHSDGDLDRQLAAAHGAASGSGVEVVAAYEGLTLDV